jgi:hypothetical protein
MAASRNRKAKEGKATMRTEDTEDDMSVDTVPSGRPPENFEEEVVESFL